MQGEKAEAASHVVGELITLIQRRQYEPGERLPSERDLAERFSVGRTTIREAVTTLESMRYLERRPGSGIFLCREPESTSLETLVLFSDLGLPIDPKVNSEVVEVRRIIEVQAIALACERRNEKDLDRISGTIATFVDADSFGDAAVRYDYDFHMNMFRATHNDILVRLVNPFYIMAQTRRQVFFKDRGRRLISHGQHVEMLDAIRRQDKTLAMSLMAGHIGRVERYFA